MNSELQTHDPQQRQVTALEKAAVVGDLAKLTPMERLVYYQGVCKSLGLNPLTKPFSYIRLNNRLTLYANKDATDQLRSIKGISILTAERDASEPEYATWVVTGKDKDGRIDTEIGTVYVGTAKGEAKANAVMKALTKAKRRLTLSLAGLGWLDEVSFGPDGAEEVDMDDVQPELISDSGEDVYDDYEQESLEETLARTPDGRDALKDAMNARFESGEG